jgi:DNA-binding CsgD family transcriptional regulator/tetratricopeptide (TPR) repeat protein
MELLEREAHMAGLEAALAEASAGSGRIALVSGEAGIGKTSLVENFTRKHQNTVRILWGACDALFTPRPLGPLHDMAIGLEGDLPALLASDADRDAIFPPFLRELQARPTVAVFEDVHWADEATLDLLRYLGRRITHTRSLLVMTYRNDELGPSHQLRIVLGDMASSSAVRRFQLPPFSESAVRALVGSRRMDAAALYHQTGGNPFFVTEVLASTGSGIPATVRDAVLARAARLSPSGHAVLEAAAIIGLRVEPWLLVEITAAEASFAEESMAAGMLIAQGDMLSFRHELARQTILETISPHRKIVLHRLALDSLKSSPATRADLARLAHHAEAAGDREAVLQFAPAAARQASNAGAHRESRLLYALALRFADDLPPDEHALMLEVYSYECNVTEQQTEAIAARWKAVEIWKQLNNHLKQGESLAQLTIMLRNHGSNAEAEQACQSAIQLLEPYPAGRELAMAYRVQATLRISTRDFAEAIKWGEKAIELAEPLGDNDVLAMAHVAVGSSWLFWDYKHGCEYLERRLEIALKSGLDTHIANLYAYLGSCSAELYQFHQAERYLTEGIAYASDRHLDLFSQYMLAWLGLTRFHLGQWDQAIGVTGPLLRRTSPSALSQIPTLVTWGSLQARSGDQDAGPVLEEALDLAKRTGTLQFLGLARAARAEAAWLSGDSKSAREEALAGYELAMSKQHPWFAGELAFWRWKAGDNVEVADWMAKPFSLQIAGDWMAAADEWGRLGCPYEQAQALVDGDVIAQLNALETFERLGARPAADQLRFKLQSSGVVNLPRGPRLSTRENPFGLTSRQVEILSLLTESLSNVEIARRLHISPKTVDHHVSAILAQLDVHSRDSAADLARQHPHFNKK